MNKKTFEDIYIEILIEEILYKRDRNPLKDWGHIWGVTSPYSYSRWNKKSIDLPYPKELLQICPSFQSVDIHLTASTTFTKEEETFLKNNNLLEYNFLEKIAGNLQEIFPKIYTVLQWKKNWYLRSSLWNTEESIFLFLSWISKDQKEEYDYYFCFKETIDESWVKNLMKSWKQDPNNIFSNIALWWYFFHHKNFLYAERFILNALKGDKNNVWFLWMYAMLLLAIWWKEKQAHAEKLMRKVILLIPDSPWWYDWLSEVLIRNGKYTEALSVIDMYEVITEWKYRTFEPYMKKAEAYIHLWDYDSAQECLKKKDIYYFWKWYSHKLEAIEETLISLWEILYTP